jgi:uncharacterized protein
MNFTISSFVPAIFGGVLIGVSAVLLMAVQNRIAGVSGIVGGALEARQKDLSWRVFFALGLMAGVLLAWRVGVVPMPATNSIGLPWIIGAGLLVGIGTALASGCTSGHGVCGISRGSGRSIVATITFMLFGMLAVFIMKSFFPQ